MASAALIYIIDALRSACEAQCVQSDRPWGAQAARRRPLDLRVRRPWTAVARLPA